MLLRRPYSLSSLIWSFALLQAVPLHAQAVPEPAQKVGSEIQVTADSLKV